MAQGLIALTSGRPIMADVTKVNCESGMIEVEDLRYADDPEKKSPALMDMFFAVFRTQPMPAAKKAGGLGN